VQKFFAQALTVSHKHPLQTHRRPDVNDAKAAIQHSCSASKTVTLHTVLTVCANFS